MNHQHFDVLTRLFATKGSRRSVLGAFLSAALLDHGRGPDADAAGRGRRKRKGGDHGKAKGKHRKQRVRAQAVPARCFPTTNCTPGPGENLFKCDFGGAATLRNQNVQGANLGQANLAAADASGATFLGANLGGACLVDANLTGASINGSTNLGKAIFCRTRMPDGSIDNGGCGRGTRCCPTCDAARSCPAGQVCCDGQCRSGTCCNGACCPGGVCQNDVCVPCAGGQVCEAGACCTPQGFAPENACDANTVCCGGGVCTTHFFGTTCRPAGCLPSGSPCGAGCPGACCSFTSSGPACQ